jgi:hypothetical protein
VISEKIIPFELVHTRIELQFAMVAYRRVSSMAAKSINNGYLAWLIQSLGGMGGVW